MPQLGIKKPAKPKKAPRPPKPQYGSEAAYTGSKQQQKAGNNKTVREVQTQLNPFDVYAVGGPNRRNLAAKGTRANTPIEKAGGTGAKYGGDLKAPSAKRTTKKTHLEQFQDEVRATKKRSGGTATGGGGGGTIGGGGRDRPGGGGKTTLGKPSGGGISSGFRDRDLVGSGNTIDEFDGSSYSSGVDTEIVGGGGGGTGSALFGREAVGRVGDTEGKSLDEVVYGVQKRGKKVRRARSL